MPESRWNSINSLRRRQLYSMAAVCIAVTISMVVYTNRLHEVTLEASQKRSSETGHKDTIQWRLDNLQGGLDNLQGGLDSHQGLLDIQRVPEPIPVVAVPEGSIKRIFSSPFILENQETATQGPENRQDRGEIKTFAVIFNCLHSAPECLIKLDFSPKDCPHQKNCRLIDDFEKADVVVFYPFRFDTEKNIPVFQRPNNQIWVMWTPEAASRLSNFAMLDFPRIRGQFNWTMTYRLDSDIPELYGRLQRRELPHKNYTDIVKGKEFPVAWFVSHCSTSSRRNEYVRRMQEVVDVHIYGGCGTKTCGVNARQDDAACLPMLSKTYFFYLAFENSFCRDYVTEKFFKMFQDVDIIPVVRGGADYKRYFPPDTFIDSSDFESPEELAKFLLDIAKNRKRYLAMLMEKSKYGVRMYNSLCLLCEKMFTENRIKWYPDLRTWFVKDQCHLPLDL